MKEKPILILAHGSGQPADSPWMNQLVQVLEAQGVETHRFNFSYMEASLKAGKPRPPSRLPSLIQEYEAQLEPFQGRDVFVGGKSLGGRVASHLATRRNLAGVVAFGYPFHPPGKPHQLRIDHLPQLLCPMLICQGERDPFGKRNEVESYQLPAKLRILWLPGGDHQFQPPKRLDTTLRANLEASGQAAAKFMELRSHEGTLSFRQN